MFNSLLRAKHFKLLIFSFLFIVASTQAQVIPLPHAYAHNDYWHKRPLFDALGDGFTHIEADVYLRHGKLLVAHKPPLLGKHVTLQDLYLAPLAKIFTNSKDQPANSMDTIVLMIDIKSNAEKTYTALRKLLSGFQPFLSGYDNGKVVIRNLTIVLTGHRPMQLLRSESSRLVFADENLEKMKLNETDREIYVTASCKYSNITKWNGSGKMADQEKKYLTGLVEMAHVEGKKVRLWASPENERVWIQLLSCGVDLINTDKLSALKHFFTGYVSAR